MSLDIYSKYVLFQVDNWRCGLIGCAILAVVLAVLMIAKRYECYLSDESFYIKKRPVIAILGPLIVKAMFRFRA